MNKEQEKTFYPAIYLDYLSESKKIKDIFAFHYKSQADCHTKKNWLYENFDAKKRDLLVKDLYAYNRSLGVSEETLKNIEVLQQPETVAVVTGQQAGILTGPLYTLYKAMATVKLARKLSQEKGIVAVPVFWIATEDHDFQEINHLTVLGQDNKHYKLELQSKDEGRPLEHISLDKKAAFDMVKKITDFTPATEFKEEIIGVITRGIEESSTYTGWFGHLMAWLFKGTGLIFFNPFLPRVRSLAAPLLASLCAQGLAVNKILDAREKNLANRGYPLQVNRGKDQLSFFAHLEDGRAALFNRGSQIATRRGEKIGTVAEVTEKMLKNPENYSPGVLTRPLLQEVFLPVLFYVAGPGEFAYFAQMESLFSFFDLKSPLLYPRPSLTFIEPRLATYINKYSLTESDIFQSREALGKYLAEKDGVEIEKLFLSLESRVCTEYQTLQESLSPIDDKLSALTETNLKRVLKEINYLKHKAEQALRKKYRLSSHHFHQIEEACLPGGHLQEQVYNIFFYLIKYGPDLREKLLDDFPMGEGHHVYNI